MNPRGRPPGRGAVASMREALAAVAADQLAPGHGAQLLGAIGTLARVAEIDELQSRIAALEKAHANA